MNIFTSLIVCEHCDTVYRRPALAPGEGVRCDVCTSPFPRTARWDIDCWLALTLAAVIVDVIANVCPVIRISFKGLHNEGTLWQSTAALAHGPITLMAVAAALVVIVLPLVQMLVLGWLLLYARARRRAPGFGMAQKLLVRLRPWSMIEVALIGILVSVIKLSGFLHVAPGTGLWAAGVLMVLFTLVAEPDPRHLWDLTESEASS